MAFNWEGGSNMKKVLLTTIALTAIGVGVRANARKDSKPNIIGLSIGAKDSYPAWAINKFWIN